MLEFSFVDLNRAIVWSNGEFSIPAKMLTWTDISLLNRYSCSRLIYDGGLISLQMIEFCSIEELTQYSREHCLNFDRWNESVFLHALFELLIQTEISIWFLTFSTVNDVNFYSCNRLIYDCGLISLHLFEFSSMIWTGWILIELIQYSREIIEPLLLSKRLNFHRWFEPVEFWSMNWSNIPAKLLNRYSWANVWFFNDDLNRLNFDWIDSVFPRNCWTVIPEW